MICWTVKGQRLRAVVATASTLLEKLKHIKEIKIGLMTALLTFEGRNHNSDGYMLDLKSAADAACTVRNSIVVATSMAARDGGSLAAMETMAKAADSAVIAS